MYACTANKIRYANVTMGTEGLDFNLKFPNSQIYQNSFFLLKSTPFPNNTH